MVRQAYSDFAQNLNRIESVLEVADGFLRGSRRERYDTANAMIDASLVLLSAFFEGYLRDLGREFADEISKKDILFNDLPMKVQETHIWHTPTWINRTKPPLLRGDIEDVARRYGSPFGRIDGRYELVSECYGDCLGNPTFVSVNEAFNRMGIGITKAAKRSGLITVNSFENWLKGFSELRNRIAHGSYGMGPTPLGDARKYVDDFRTLADFMQHLVTQQIMRIEKTKKPNKK